MEYRVYFIENTWSRDEGMTLRKIMNQFPISRIIIVASGDHLSPENAYTPFSLSLTLAINYSLTVVRLSQLPIPATAHSRAYL